MLTVMRTAAVVVLTAVHYLHLDSCHQFTVGSDFVPTEGFTFQNFYWGEMKFNNFHNEEKTVWTHCNTAFHQIPAHRPRYTHRRMSPVCCGSRGHSWPLLSHTHRYLWRNKRVTPPLTTIFSLLLTLFLLKSKDYFTFTRFLVFCQDVPRFTVAVGFAAISATLLRAASVLICTGILHCNEKADTREHKSVWFQSSRDSSIESKSCQIGHRSQGRVRNPKWHPSASSLHRSALHNCGC